MELILIGVRALSLIGASAALCLLAPLAVNAQTTPAVNGPSAFAPPLIALRNFFKNTGAILFSPPASWKIFKLRAALVSNRGGRCSCSIDL